MGLDGADGHGQHPQKAVPEDALRIIYCSAGDFGRMPGQRANLTPLRCLQSPPEFSQQCA